jgi:DNA mismatch repair protein MLH3
MACVQFSKEDLLHATFLSQVDDKFICCLVSHRDGRKTLVMIDQHAADERVRVERLLKETLQQFRATQVTSTALAELAHVIQLPLEQVEWLMARPERLDLFAKWGFRISYLTDPLVKTDNYSSIAIESVPTLLCNRLGASGGKEVKGIIAGYIAFLQTQPDEGILALVKTLRDSAACPGLDTDGLLRWMPKRMKELIDSKACRGR